MYQLVEEKIKVLAVFKNGTVFPYIFQWGNRKYIVNKVNLSYQEREGVSANYYFAVESKELVAKIKYNDKSLIWLLEEVWVE